MTRIVRRRGKRRRISGRRNTVWTKGVEAQ